MDEPVPVFSLELKALQNERPEVLKLAGNERYLMLRFPPCCLHCLCKVPLSFGHYIANNLESIGEWTLTQERKKPIGVR